MASINSPFRYAGGKFYARNLILEHVPTHTCYVEPFAGGASIFFAKPKVQYNQLNDLDEQLINTYLIIRDNPHGLIEFLASEQASKERHAWYKNVFQPQNDLEKAGRWYYLNRTSYSGIMKAENCYWGYGDKYSMRPENWGRNILRTSEKLQQVRITMLDFEEVIEQAPDDSFLFIDPPYYGADQDKFYNHCLTHEGHSRLAATLQRHLHRIKFLVTYDNVPAVRELYPWASQILDKEWNYTISRTDDQKNGLKLKDNHKGGRYKGKEIFILNYNTETVATLITKQIAMTF